MTVISFIIAIVLYFAAVIGAYNHLESTISSVSIGDALAANEADLKLDKSDSPLNQTARWRLIQHLAGSREVRPGEQNTAPALLESAMDSAGVSASMPLVEAISRTVSELPGSRNEDGIKGDSHYYNSSAATITEQLVPKRKAPTTCIGGPSAGANTKSGFGLRLSQRPPVAGVLSCVFDSYGFSSETGLNVGGDDAKRAQFVGMLEAFIAMVDQSDSVEQARLAMGFIAWETLLIVILGAILMGIAIVRLIAVKYPSFLQKHQFWWRHATNQELEASLSGHHRYARFVELLPIIGLLGTVNGFRPALSHVADFVDVVSAGGAAAPALGPVVSNIAMALATTGVGVALYILLFPFLSYVERKEEELLEEKNTRKK